jgi:hypothetical protein
MRRKYLYHNRYVSRNLQNSILFEMKTTILQAILPLLLKNCRTFVAMAVIKWPPSSSARHHSNSVTFANSIIWAFGLCKNLYRPTVKYVCFIIETLWHYIQAKRLITKSVWRTTLRLPLSAFSCTAASQSEGPEFKPRPETGYPDWGGGGVAAFLSPSRQIEAPQRAVYKWTKVIAKCCDVQYSYPAVAYFQATFTCHINADRGESQSVRCNSRAAA